MILYVILLKLIMISAFSIEQVYWFCKYAVWIVFALSLFSKVINFSLHVHTVSNFRLVPEAFVGSVAKSILVLEVFILVCFFVNPVAAFWLATTLLLVFTIVLSSALIRNIQTACNCFGTGHHSLSLLDILRNSGFLCCSCGGGWLATTNPEIALASPLGSNISSLVALGFVLIWIHLNDISRIFIDIKKPSFAPKTFYP